MKWIWCWCLWGALLSAREPVDFLMSSLSAKGKIKVMASDAVQVQKLSFWSERSLKQLETDWQAIVPFQAGQPLIIVVDKRADKVGLKQSWHQGIFQQTLMLSEASLKEEPRELAEAFTRALAFRVGLAAMPAGQKNRQWQVPDWLVTGSAHALLAGRSRMLFEGLVLEYAHTSPPYPEQIVGGDGVDEPSAAALCQWIFTSRQENLWTWISMGDFRSSEVWTTRLPNIGSLRELHQHWDVWWLNNRNRLISEYRMEAPARENLNRLRIFVPAFYGLSVEGENRYAPIGFGGLELYLDDARFGVAMQEWIVRLQRLRFRQSPEFNAQVEGLQEAGRWAIRAAREKGRKRERMWSEALALYADAS
ncbi:hypothetical protein P0Y35_14170 [Kiritimatiellaeota bacterium B1221]|nr:hypothetical protein [Kiritimatiellaeota bacterium B1221]